MIITPTLYIHLSNKKIFIKLQVFAISLLLFFGLNDLNSLNLHLILYLFALFKYSQSDPQSLYDLSLKLKK